MKKLLYLTIIAVLASSALFAQSESYLMLRDKFKGHENVVAISTSGWLTRTVLLMAGEQEFNKAIKDVRHVKLTTIPKQAFRAEKVTVDGFIRKTKEDGFEELLTVADHGEEITLLLQEPNKKNRESRYLLVVDDHDEVVVMEITGYIDHKKLLSIYKKENNSYYRKI